jgi:flavin-binding protein dodecin
VCITDTVLGAILLFAGLIMMMRSGNSPKPLLSPYTRNALKTGLGAQAMSANVTGRDGAIDHAIKTEYAGGLSHGHIYRVIELVGTSEKSIEDAVNAAIGRAHKTIRNLRWFEITRTSGHIEDGKVRHFQVTLKVGFTMEDAS